ncbi:MAG TPA: gephyrin-like molybdotransferase Glp, partial [Solirubrobacterales bacterium]|nr:gephyrin-like molybdotransferase Glp [Solirubrobacterales bacterium]
LAAAAPTAAVAVPLAEALGLHLAADVVAAEALQPFDNSAMDGYAVRAADLAGATAAAPAVLDLVGESSAGHPATAAVGAGEAIAISTGAVVPDGADAVVRVEDTARAAAGVEFHVAPARGANVRRAGEDVAAGETVLRRGERLEPAALAVLAALGIETASCHRRPGVAVVVSGDELVPAGEPVPPGGIRDSNSTLLAGLIARQGAALHRVGRAGDSLAATVAALEPATAADVVLVCGGISVGAHDHVKAAFEQLGVEQRFWRIALRPGGPAYFGTRDGQLVFGLPGNPVSVFATFTLLVAPALAALAGGSPERRRTTATLTAPYEKTTERAEAVRCGLELTAAGWSATPRPRQGSHVLTSLLGADCLALIPPAARRLEAGARVEIELLDQANLGR